MNVFNSMFQHLLTIEGVIGSILITFLVCVLCLYLDRLSRKTKQETVKSVMAVRFPRAYSGFSRMSVSMSPELGLAIRQASKNYRDFSDFVRETMAYRIVEASLTGDELFPVTPYQRGKKPRKKLKRPNVPEPVMEPLEEPAPETAPTQD